MIVLRVRPRIRSVRRVGAARAIAEIHARSRHDVVLEILLQCARLAHGEPSVRRADEQVRAIARGQRLAQVRCVRARRVGHADHDGRHLVPADKQHQLDERAFHVPADRRIERDVQIGRDASRCITADLLPVHDSALRRCTGDSDPELRLVRAHHANELRRVDRRTGHEVGRQRELRICTTGAARHGYRGVHHRQCLHVHDRRAEQRILRRARRRQDRSGIIDRGQVAHRVTQHEIAERAGAPRRGGRRAGEVVQRAQCIHVLAGQAREDGKVAVRADRRLVATRIVDADARNRVAQAHAEVGHRRTALERHVQRLQPDGTTGGILADEDGLERLADDLFDTLLRLLRRRHVHNILVGHAQWVAAGRQADGAEQRGQSGESDLHV